MSEPKDTLILCLKQPASGGYALWWGPDRRGYYAELEGAGRYTRSEAESICRHAEVEPAFALPVPESEAIAAACTVVDIDKVNES
jgi:hypothetical protein